MPLELQRKAVDLEVAFAPSDDMRFKPGRRHHVKYRDLGVEAATQGDMRAEVLHVAATGERQETGWHYHDCEVQWLYVIQGTGRIEFLDGTAYDLKAGDSLMIPGGTIHQEMGTGEAGETIEVTIPARFETINVDIDELRREGRAA